MWGKEIGMALFVILINWKKYKKEKDKILSKVSELKQDLNEGEFKYLKSDSAKDYKFIREKIKNIQGDILEIKSWRKVLQNDKRIEDFMFNV